MVDTSFDNADNATQLRLFKKVTEDNDPNDAPMKDSKEASQKIHDSIQAVKAAQRLIKITEFKSLRTKNRITFYNCVCQVIAVLVPKEQEEPPVTYLRVTDGTTYDSEKMNYRVHLESVDLANSKTDVRLNQLLWSSSVDICCYDEFSGKAKELNPGDIVGINNFRVKVSNSVAFFDLNGVGTMPPHIARSRGLDLLVEGDWNLRELVRVVGQSIEDSDSNVSSSVGLAESQDMSPLTVHNVVEQILRSVSKMRVQCDPMSALLRFQDLSVKIMQSFFDNICQVIGVLVPDENEFGVVYVRVADGTFWQGETKKFELSDEVVLKEDVSKLDKNMYDLLWEASSGRAVFDIGFYDEHTEEALKLMPGDIVKLTNLRIKKFGESGAITMNGKGERFNRGITLLSRHVSADSASFRCEEPDLPIPDTFQEPDRVREEEC